MDATLEALRTGTGLDEAIDRFITLPAAEQISLLEKLNGVRDEKLGIFLNLLYPRTGEKDIRKLIKKALFRLKTMGIHVEEPVEPGGPALHRIEVAREEVAFLSNYDAEGLRVALIASESRRRQVIFIHSVTHFSEGLVVLKSLPVPRVELDGLLKDYEQRAGTSIVLPPVSPRYAAYVIEEAERSSARYEAEIKEMMPFLSRLKGHPQKPQDLYDLDAPTTAREASLDRILEHSIFDPFLLTWPDLDSDRTAFEEAINPGIVLPPYVKEERKTAFLDKLAASERMESFRRLLIRLLEDYAYLFYCLKDFDYYKGLAGGLKDEQALKAVMRFFFERSLQKKEPEQQGVLVSPYDRQPRRNR